MKKGINTIIFVLIIIYSYSQVPEWINSYPVDSSYYIGIGHSSKKNNNLNYYEIAKNIALERIASEISVQISGTNYYKTSDVNNQFSEEFTSEVVSSTQSNLEGFELVSKWENEEEYWVYYHLSKSLYKIIRDEKIEKAKLLSYDLYKRGKFHESKGEISEALSLYLNALEPVVIYLNQSLVVEDKGTDLYLGNQLYNSVFSLLNNLKINSDTSEIKVILKKTNEVFVTINTSFSPGKNGIIPVSGLPLSCTFINGEGSVIPDTRTDENGQCKILINQFTYSKETQTLEFALNIKEFYNQDQVSSLFEKFVSGFPVPSHIINIIVYKPSVNVSSVEKTIEKTLDVNIVEPKLKFELISSGFTFENNPKLADISISIIAESRKGSEIQGLFTSYANVLITIIDIASDEEIFKNLYEQRGGGLSYEKAAIEALGEISDEVSKSILSELNSQ